MNVPVHTHKAMAVAKVLGRQDATVYVLNVTSTGNQGVVTIKHTKRDTFVCNTCNVADVRGRQPDGDRHRGCQHTAVAVEQYEREGEPEPGQTWTYETRDGQRVRTVTDATALPTA